MVKKVVNGKIINGRKVKRRAKSILWKGYLNKSNSNIIVLFFVVSIMMIVAQLTQTGFKGIVNALVGMVCGCVLSYVFYHK